MVQQRNGVMPMGMGRVFGLFMILFGSWVHIIVATSSENICRITAGRSLICENLYQDSDYVPQSAPTNLIIRNSNLTEVTSAFFCQFPSLETLHIHNSTLPPPESTILSCLNLITTLIITNCDFAEQHCHLIESMNALEHVSLMNNDLSHVPTQLIDRLHYLKKIDLRRNKIKNIGEETLNYETRLTILLSRNEFCINDLSTKNKTWQEFKCKVCNDEAQISKCLNELTVDLVLVPQTEISSENEDNGSSLNHVHGVRGETGDKPTSTAHPFTEVNAGDERSLEWPTSVILSAIFIPVSIVLFFLLVLFQWRYRREQASPAEAETGETVPAETSVDIDSLRFRLLNELKTAIRDRLPSAGALSRQEEEPLAHGETES